MLCLGDPAQNQVPAPSREDSNDGLIHGQAAMRALNQVREAASRRAEAKANAAKPQAASPAEEGLLADAAGDTPEETTEEFDLFHNVVFLVDVEDPDAPSWAEALELDQCDKWLEGAEAELNGLHEMKVYELVSRREVPANRSVLRSKFICRLKRDEIGNPVCHKSSMGRERFSASMGEGF
jgi:hypothetical protein